MIIIQTKTPPGSTNIERVDNPLKIYENHSNKQSKVQEREHNLFAAQNVADHNNNRKVNMQVTGSCC